MTAIGARVLRLFVPSTLPILGLAAIALALPFSAVVSWLLFATILLSSVLYSKRYLSLGQTCLLLGGLMLVAAASAYRYVGPKAEFLAFLASGMALLAGSVATLIARTRVLHYTDRSAANGPMVACISPVLSMGEKMAALQKARKLSLAAPKYIQPTWEQDFKQIQGMADFKKKLRDAGLECAGPADRNGIFLHGEPGNGKTVFAKALAGELGLEFIPIQKVMSKWIGEESQNLFNQLHEAIARSPCVISLDEADSILGSRSDGGQSSHLNETNAILNRLLTYLVDYRRSGVVFVAATNFIDRIDPAVRRAGRFDFVFEVPNPDLQARMGLLTSGISKHGCGVPVEAGVVESLAKRWNGFSTATVLSVPQRIPQYVKDTGKGRLGFSDFMAMLRLQQGIANRVPETTKAFAEMSYPTEQADTIKSLIGRIESSFEIEESGGQAPSGVLFYGDPGTGKTETARMIAKETGWAFFPLSGSDIARNPEMLEKTLKQVRNARPAIIFIDEADDLLADRGNSPYKAATNKLLEAMDGATGRLNDVLWIASTNFADMSDAAVLRSGRFTEKVRFHKPGDASLLKLAKAFLGDSKRQAVMDVSWDEVSDVLQGCSIADAHGILMQAWNMTLTAKGGIDRSNPFTREVLLRARDQLMLS